MSEALTIEELAELFRVSEWTARKWCREGRLPATKVGQRWLVPKAKLTTKPWRI